jgi:hypothetical protein
MLDSNMLVSRNIDVAWDAMVVEDVDGNTRW